MLDTLVAHPAEATAGSYLAHHDLRGLALFCAVDRTERGIVLDQLRETSALHAKGAPEDCKGDVLICCVG